MGDVSNRRLRSKERALPRFYANGKSVVSKRFCATVGACLHLFGDSSANKSNCFSGLGEPVSEAKCHALNEKCE